MKDTEDRKKQNKTDFKRKEEKRPKRKKKHNECKEIYKRDMT